MPTNVDIPSLGESISEAVLLRWLKQDGDAVAAGDALAELETDKANVDLPAPAAGVLRRAKDEGETVQIGETIARIDEAGAGTAAAANSGASSSAGGTQPKAATAPAVPMQRPAAAALAAAPPHSEDLSPAVRRLVDEHKLEPRTIPASGPGGRLTKEDVQKHLDSLKGGNGRGAQEEDDSEEQDSARSESNARGLSDADAPVPTAKTPGPKVPAAAKQVPGPTAFDASGIKRVPMSKIRKRIADRLVAAQHTAAILTTVNEIDLTEVLAIRARYKERFTEVYGVALGLMSFFARGVVLALKEFPRINAEIDGDDIVYHNYVNLGIAVSTDRGLAVPVLRNAEQMSFARVESEIKRLAAATREGKLGLQELSGGTFTITNGGVYGSLLSTPILNPPQSGILGMHAIKSRPMAMNEKIEIRPMMYVALSYDHRLVDGKESVSFLVRLKEFLEDPARLMLEI